MNNEELIDNFIQGNKNRLIDVLAMDNKIEDGFEKITIPLLFDKDNYSIKLEPTSPHSINQEFVVSMRCKKTLVVSPEFLSIAKDLSHFIQENAETILKQCLWEEWMND